VPQKIGDFFYRSANVDQFSFLTLKFRSEVRMKLKLKLSHPLKAVDAHLAKKCEAVQFYIHISEENLLLVRRLLFDKDYFICIFFFRKSWMK